MLYRRTLRLEIVVHLFRGQIGRMKHRRHPAGALHCGISIRCRQMLCHRELPGCSCRRPPIYSVCDAVSTHTAPRNGGASVSGAAGLFAAHSALRSYTVQADHAQILAKLCHGEQQGVGATDADYSVRNAVSPRATRRKCSASVSAATWAFAAYETLSSRCALRHHDRVQANVVSQRAARAC
jgi:hypothetical protein